MRIRGVLPAIAMLMCCGCGDNKTSLSTSKPPTIVTEPGDQSVPVAQRATFSVVAAGTPELAYQWRRSGVDIPGETSASYSIASTSIADENSNFDVVITNKFGEVTSRSALLSIGPRYPAAGDLRFQQVDAVTTVNGYVGLASSNLPGNTSYFQTNAFGNPLSVGPGCSGTNGPPEFACNWIIDTFYLPAGTPSLSVGYRGFNYSNLPSTLVTLSDPTIVVTGMDLEPLINTTAFSWMQQTAGLAFDGALHTVPLGNLQAAVQNEASLGRVVTAVSFDNSQVSFMSYGWQGNGSVRYDTEAMTASITDAAAVATNMAADGYILTAMGGKQDSGVILIGTRVHSDSLPRPILVVPGGQSPTLLSTQGYATVGVLFGSTGFIDWIGER